MAKSTINKITSAEKKAKGVVALADKPNSTSSYGVSGLSATNLKVWFDKLSNYLADKINEIITALEDSGQDYISIDNLGDDISSLADLTAALLDGTFATIMQLYQTAADAASTGNLKSLQTIVSNLSALIADNTEALSDYKTEMAAELASYKSTINTAVSKTITETLDSLNAELKAAYKTISALSGGKELTFYWDDSGRLCYFYPVK